MPAIEYIIRPFTSPASNGRLIISHREQGTLEHATLTWGAKSPVPPVKPQGVQFAGCCTESSNEHDDQGYDQVTVQAPSGGPSAGQTITFRRANSFSFDRDTKDACAGDWDQFSGVGMEVTAALDQFSADIHSGTAGVTETACMGKATINNFAAS